MRVTEYNIWLVWLPYKFTANGKENVWNIIVLQALSCVWRNIIFDLYGSHTSSQRMGKKMFETFRSASIIKRVTVYLIFMVPILVRNELQRKGLKHFRVAGIVMREWWYSWSARAREAAVEKRRHICVSFKRDGHSFMMTSNTTAALHWKHQGTPQWDDHVVLWSRAAPIGFECKPRSWLVDFSIQLPLAAEEYIRLNGCQSAAVKCKLQVSCSAELSSRVHDARADTRKLPDPRVTAQGEFHNTMTWNEPLFSLKWALIFLEMGEFLPVVNSSNHAPLRRMSPAPA